MNLMICYDESESASKGLELVTSRAELLGARVFVVSIMPSGADISEREIKQQEKALDRIKRQLQQKNISCEVTLSVSSESPGEALVSFARENSIDEVVVGIKRRSKVGKLIFGSTAQYVILFAPCPVVTVKSDKKAAEPLR